jgi:hypothetical protein
VGAALLPVATYAEVFCLISDFQLDAYDHSGTYIHGKVNGGPVVLFMSLCGKTSGAQDCNSKATDRRLALALAAQAQGKTLLAYFEQYSSCAQLQSYAIVTGLRTSD